MRLHWGSWKKFAVFFCLLLAVILFLAPLCTCVESSISKPETPEFTLDLVSNPYDVPPTTTTDPYTGKIVITQEGYHAENQTIIVTIKNQPFTPFSANGSTVSLRYQIQIKGYYENDTAWKFYSFIKNMSPYPLGDYIPQSDLDYTVVSVSSDYERGSKVDFRVRALVGELYVQQSGLMGDMVFFNGSTGEWSDPQTITIAESTTATATTPIPQSTSNSPTQNPETTNQPIIQTGGLFGFEWEQIALAILVIVIVVMAVGIVALWRKNGIQKQGAAQ